MTLLTEEDFSKHVGTKFYAKLGEREVDLTLSEVRGYVPEPTEQKKMERFSLFFDGPADSFLPQQNFEMRHETLGQLDIFLVPIKGDENGFRYEAVFNFFK